MTNQEELRLKNEELKQSLQKEKDVEIDNRKKVVAELATREIIGFEDINDSDILRVSYVRIVQPMSKNITKIDGTEAQLGEFFFNDSKQSSDSIEICYLKGKMVDFNFKKKDGTDDWKRQLKILAITIDPQAIIILTLTPMSFGNFGKFKSQLKAKQATAGYQYKTLLSTHKEENDQGKFWIVDFEVGEQNSEGELEAYSKVFEDYKNVLESKKVETKDDSGPHEPGSDDIPWK